MQRHITAYAVAILLLVPLMLSGAACPAMMAQEKGLSIAQEMHRHDQGWGDQRLSMQMILRNCQGQRSERMIRVCALDGDGDKSPAIFDQPWDLKGTAFLSFTHAPAPDEQWLYLPALKRVKRISSVNKSGPFMRSGFVYQDLTSREVDKYSYRWLRDEELNGHDTMVSERIPVVVSQTGWAICRFARTTIRCNALLFDVQTTLVEV
jgi:hypothetical protein